MFLLCPPTPFQGLCFGVSWATGNHRQPPATAGNRRQPPAASEIGNRKSEIGNLKSAGRALQSAGRALPCSPHRPKTVGFKHCPIRGAAAEARLELTSTRIRGCDDPGDGGYLTTPLQPHPIRIKASGLGSGPYSD